MFAVDLHGKPASTDAQAEFCMRMIRRPVSDAARDERVWTQHVYAQRAVYEMNP